MGPSACRRCDVWRVRPLLGWNLPNRIRSAIASSVLLLLCYAGVHGPSGRIEGIGLWLCSGHQDGSGSGREGKVGYLASGPDLIAGMRAGSDGKHQGRVG